MVFHTFGVQLQRSKSPSEEQNRRKLQSNKSAFVLYEIVKEKPVSVMLLMLWTKRSRYVIILSMGNIEKENMCNQESCAF